MLEIIGDSRAVARAAIQLAMTATREEETELKASLTEKDIVGAASDFGGTFVDSMMKMIERAVVAAKREGVISDTHREEGAVAGAAHDAVCQVSEKAMGFSVGGKIGVARSLPWAWCTSTRSSSAWDTGRFEPNGFKGATAKFPCAPTGAKSPASSRFT